MTIETPRRPLPIRALNLAYAAARRIGANPLPLRKYALMDRASRQASGLTDFGDPRFEDGLDHLLDSLVTEDRLNGLGRMMAASHITNLLRQRLLVTAHIRQHPEIRDEVIKKPIFIVGAPRTGTTITHHLLAQDDRFRFPITWECDELHPPLDPATMYSDPRIKRTDKQIRRVLSLAPELEAANEPGTWEAQECALLHAYAFLSETFHVMFNCQSYDRWLDEQDRTWVYEEQKLLLQYMQSGGLRPAESWLLKTPPHMSNIDKILAVFPDARFVTTYREPTEIVASSCSLTGIVFGMVEDSVDWHDHGRHIQWRVSTMLERNVQLRRQFAHRSEQFIDYSMEQVASDPIGCVQKFYAHFDIELPDATHHKMIRFMGEHSLAKRKPHIYRAEDYGLDVGQLWPQLQFYRDFYGIEHNRDRATR